jgi:hypothetical protein
MTADEYVEHAQKKYRAVQCDEGPMPPKGVSFRKNTTYESTEVPVKKGKTTVIETHAIEHTSCAFYVKAQPVFLLALGVEGDVGHETLDEAIDASLKPLPGEVIDPDCDTEYNAIAFLFLKSNRERVQLALINVKAGRVMKCEPFMDHEPERLAFAMAKLIERDLPILSVLFEDGKIRKMESDDA